MSRIRRVELDALLTAAPTAPAAVALGTFDGVHLGHAAILARTRDEARRRGLRSVAFTFDRHPLTVVAPKEPPPKLLTPLDERCRLMVATGIDEVWVARFDPAFAQVSPETFMERILAGALSARSVVVGYNYTFGHRAAGKPHLLLERGGELGFETLILPPVEVQGERVSSTRIRQWLSEGETGAAARMLGRPFALLGDVVHGDGRGRRIGAPTANLRPDPQAIVPTDGVYVCRLATLGPAGEDRPVGGGLCVIGTRPTFTAGHGAERTIECFVLDFSGDLYDAKARVTFGARLRDVVRFADAEALKAQIGRDVAQARAALAAWPE